MVDLDGVATSPPLSEVVEAMTPWLHERHANPASKHVRGTAAATALAEARASVASLVGSDPEDVVFTSGATEANNLAIHGAARLALRAGRSILAVAAHEHPSLLHPARSLARRGCRLQTLSVAHTGRLEPSALPDSSLGVFSVSHAHTELGTLQPVSALVDSARDRDALTLVDAALTVGRFPWRLDSLGSPDLLSLSFHRMGGPMGVGALVIRRGIELPPLLEGGVQEGGVRPGSPFLAGCVGAGVAAAAAERDAGGRRLRLHRAGHALASGLSRVAGVRLTGASETRLPGHVSVVVEDVDGEALALALSDRGILAGTGSPCADEAGMPSVALVAAGFSRDEARGAMTFCFPPTVDPSTEAVTRRLVEIVEEEICRLRTLSGRMRPASP